MSPVPQLESDMVHLYGLACHEVDRVMIRTAAQERKEIAHPVADLETENIAVEIHGGLDVGDLERNMAQLVWGNTGRLKANAGWHGVDKDFHPRPLRVFEFQDVGNIGLAIGETPGFDAVGVNLLGVSIEIG